MEEALSESSKAPEEEEFDGRSSSLVTVTMVVTVLVVTMVCFKVMLVVESMHVAVTLSDRNNVLADGTNTDD